MNPEIEKDATSFAFLPSGCTPGEDCDAVRAIVLSISDLNPIADGARLFTCNVAISATATGDYELTCSNAGAGNTEGDKVGADCTSGTITVAVATQATLVVSDGIGTAGGNATLSVSLETEVLVAGTQNDITFPAGVGVVADNRGKPACFVNPEIGKDATSFAYQPSGCPPGDDCTGVRALGGVTVKMGNAPHLSAVAAACSDRVFTPPSSGCCGFAGDRGFLVPELTEAATRIPAAEVRAVTADGHYSSSRTCEIGMSRATGRHYRSWIQLLDWASGDDAEIGDRGPGIRGS